MFTRNNLTPPSTGTTTPNPTSEPVEAFASPEDATIFPVDWQLSFPSDLSPPPTGTTTPNLTSHPFEALVDRQLSSLSQLLPPATGTTTPDPTTEDFEAFPLQEGLTGSLVDGQLSFLDDVTSRPSTGYSATLPTVGPIEGSPQSLAGSDTSFPPDLHCYSSTSTSVADTTRNEGLSNANLNFNTESGLRSPASPSAATSHASCTQCGTGRKRKRSFHNDRIIRARQFPRAPTYEVKQSQVTPGQQKAILWLSQSGKRDLDEVKANFLGRWGGVKPTYQGTCVLCPEAFRAVAPSSLVHLTDLKQFPSRDSDRLTF